MSKNELFYEPVGKEEFEKNYSEGYFAYLAKASKSGKSLAGYIISFIAIGIIFNLPMILGVLGLLADLSEGEGIEKPTLVLLAVGLVWFGLSTLLLRLGIKRANRTADDWIKVAADNSFITEAQVREFDNQVKGGKWSFLTLKGKRDSTTLHILTEDYILASTGAIILVTPIKDILAACYTYYENFNNRRITYQALGFVTSKRSSMIDSDQKHGDAFLAFLKERNPAIDTSETGNLSETKFAEWAEKWMKGAK